MMEPKDFGIVGFADRAFDKQNTRCYHAIFMNEGLVQRLIEQGSYSDALVVDILGLAHQAWVMAGLTAEERPARLYLLSFLNFCIWGAVICRSVWLFQRPLQRGRVGASCCATTRDGEKWCLLEM
jgi:hypothetical protein